MFFKISTSDYLLCLRNAKTGIQDKCCYSEDISITHLYSSYSVRFGSINSTAIHNNQANSPYWKSSEEFTSFFNNHSYLQGNVNCYALYPTPYKEDNNCFFSGSSGVGNYPVHHASTTSNCVLTKFNLVNNSDSSGYFLLGNGNKKRIKDSVISFKSKSSLKWLYSADSDSILSIEGCFAIASSSIDGDEKVTLTKGSTLTISAKTHKPFRLHPYHEQCSYFYQSSSNNYSSSFSSLGVLSTIIILCVPIILK